MTRAQAAAAARGTVLLALVAVLAAAGGSPRVVSTDVLVTSVAAATPLWLFLRSDPPSAAEQLDANNTKEFLRPFIRYVDEGQRRALENASDTFPTSRARSYLSGSRMRVSSGVKVALIRVVFDQALYVQRRASEGTETWDEQTPCDGASENVAWCAADTRGLTRLVCGTVLFESRPGLREGTVRHAGIFSRAPPDHLLSGHDLNVLAPLLALPDTLYVARFVFVAAWLGAQLPWQARGGRGPRVHRGAHPGALPAYSCTSGASKLDAAQ